LKLRHLPLLPLLPLVLVLLLLVSACGRKDLPAPELYERHCARCHGDRGQGVPRGLKLYPRLDLLTSPMVRQGDRATVRQRIAEGHDRMPAFKRRLTPEEIERMVDFTFQLSQTPNIPEKPKENP
jgi:mono/diheme cytochrome c family protein